MKKKSEHSRAASAIRKELKENFPDTKFRVHSSVYAGGSSINIYWEDGPSTSTVKLFSDKYQYGQFDGMTDMYEYSNDRKDIPQVKYIMEERNMSEERSEQMKLKLEHDFGVTDDESSMEKLNIWFYQALNKMFRGGFSHEI